MKTIVITGAGGFIARHLSERLGQAGYRVIGVSRSGVAPGCDSVVKAALGDTFEPVLREGTPDAVIHTANHAGRNEYSVNVDGVTRWFAEAQQAGVPNQLLLSSLSARADADTDYGRAKYELERRFTEAGEVAVRLGVVVGNGGMFARMVAPLRKPGFVPLLDGGRGRIHVVGVQELCAILHSMIESHSHRGAVLHLQQPTSHSLRDVLAAIRRAYGFRCRFVPIPSLPVLWLLSILERLRVELPVNATNVRGLRRSRHESFPSDFLEFFEAEIGLDELVRRAAEEDK